MRIPKAFALAIIVVTSTLVPPSSALAASECPTSGALSGWGVDSTGYFTIGSGGTCLFPIRMEGAVTSSSISKKPAHGTLKKLNVSTFQYSAKAGYKGSDSFAITATGKGPTSSGTSIVTMNATMQ